MESSAAISLSMKMILFIMVSDGADHDGLRQ
jgi:hypothetical protein